MVSRRDKIPIVVSVTDNVGIPEEEYAHYKKLGLKWHKRTLGRVKRGDLKQGLREFHIGDNIVVRSLVCFNMQYVDVVVGAEADVNLEEKPCYCCSPCLVAGQILAVYADIDEFGKTEYLEDAHYYADIAICQAAPDQIPRMLKEESVTKSGARSNISITRHENASYGTSYVFNAIFSDYQNHQVGDNVLVLVQPLYAFQPLWGVFSPCINDRNVAAENVEFPKVTITEAFINSTGKSCQIMLDEQIWNEDFNELEEPPDPPADEKYNPFRVLPIKIDSCLNTVI